MNNSSSFSVVAKHYWPLLRWQVGLYPAITLILCFAGFAVFRYVMAPFGAFIFGLSGYLLTFGGLIWAFRNREAEATLSVSQDSRLAFILLYSYIGMPLLVAIPMLVLLPLGISSQQITESILAKNGASLPDGYMAMSVVSNFISVFAAVSTALWIVFKVKSHRFWWGFLAIIAMNIIVGLLAGIPSAIMAVREGINAAKSGGIVDPGEFQTHIITMLMPIVVATQGLLLAWGGVACGLACRAIKRTQEG